MILLPHAVQCRFPDEQRRKPGLPDSSRPLHENNHNRPYYILPIHISPPHQQTLSWSAMTLHYFPQTTSHQSIHDLTYEIATLSRTSPKDENPNRDRESVATGIRGSTEAAIDRIIKQNSQFITRLWQYPLPSLLQDRICHLTSVFKMTTTFPPNQHLLIFVLFRMQKQPVSFIKQNVELFGFQTEEEAMYTAFVEVLDNCIDAIISDGNRKDEEREIRISLRPSSTSSITSSTSSQQYTLSAVDNGIVHFTIHIMCRNWDEK